MLPHGCIEPLSLYEALAASRGHPSAPPTLYGGLQFGDYAFLGPGLSGEAADVGGLGPGYRYVTWQVGPRIRHLVRGGRIGILPLRFRDIPRVFGPGGRLAADVAMIQCSPPRDGTVSLGISCSIFPSVIAAAKLVIAEIHPDMPPTQGCSEVPADLIDVAVDATGPLGTLARAVPDEVDERIIEHVLRLVPEDGWVQLGVGAIPDALLTRLHEIPGASLHSGMLTDGLADFLAAAPSAARVVTGEIEGSHEMYRRAADDPRVSFQPTTVIHDVPHLAQLERFVSINSAIEVDRDGQVNGETIDGVQVSGVGGSLDFVEAARYSAGGRSVIALRSTAKGRSRIVARLAAGAAVTVPRFAVDAVVTEHGVAELTGLDLDERAEALIEIAAPEARAELRELAGARHGG
ncbi:MAG: acetyl-CoA hydrolase/transferase C-terminal domain-containing protein [Thermodesulfobacteriota bacterium]